MAGTERLLPTDEAQQLKRVTASILKDVFDNDDVPVEEKAVLLELYRMGKQGVDTRKDSAPQIEGGELL